jgi:phospholipid-binding lipoprotein MlaA
LILTSILLTSGVPSAFANEVVAAQDDMNQAASVEDANDPLEPMNRFFFDLNELLLHVLLRPIGKAYAFLPGYVRTAIGNALDNLNSPVILANDLMQGEGWRALDTIGRLAINSTAGVGGLFDVAEKFVGLEKHDEDFGQTLGVWGVGEGFYLVLPLFGPSSPRDALGKLGVDHFLDPLGLYLENSNRDAAKYSRMSLTAVDEYSGVMDELEQVKKTSIDYYAAIRSMYRQKRKSLIENGNPDELPPIPELSYELEDDHSSDSAFAANDVTQDLNGK